jgi:hypothetical protein
VTTGGEKKAAVQPLWTAFAAIEIERDFKLIFVTAGRTRGD